MQIAGYSATELRFEHAGVEIVFFTVAGLERLVDTAALLREEYAPEPPYWAHLWLGARALARFIAEAPLDLRERRLLDLGCGLGLCGLVAAMRGADVLFADRVPAALEFVRASSLRNRIAPARTRVLDFTSDSLGARFDYILGAEIVYDPSAYRPLADFLDRHLAPGGTALVTDAFRSDAVTFFSDLEVRGLSGERYARREWEDGRPHGVVIRTFRRSGDLRRSAP